MPHYIYIARCKDGSLYIGSTENLQKRIATHNAGKGANFIQRHGEAKIAYFEKFNNQLAAKRRERQIKKWSRVKKENLVKFGHPTKISNS